MLHKNLTLTLPFSKAFSKIKSIVFDILFYLIIAFSFLGCVNLLGHQGVFILVSVILMAVYVFLKSKIVINITFGLAIVFAVSYSVAAFLYNRDYLFSTILYGTLLIALVQFFNCFEDKKKFVIWMSSAYIAGLFVAFILIAISTYWVQGPDFTGDVFNSFWTNNYGNRTGLSLYEIGAISVFIALLFFRNKYCTWYTFPLIIFFLVGSAYVSLQIGNRSFLVALFVLFYAILTLKMFSKKYSDFWTVVLILYNIVFVSFFVLYFLVQSQAIVLPEEIMSIKIFYRIFSENISEGRPELWKEFFDKFYLYPFGGLTNEMSNRYAHNIFLDFYTFGGAIPFLVALVFFVFLFIDLVYFLRLNSHQAFEKALIISIIFGVIGLGLVEPIYQANPNCATPLFIVFLYMHYCHQTEKITERSKVMSIKHKKEFSLFKSLKYYFRTVSLNNNGEYNKIAHSAKVNTKSIAGYNKIGKRTYFEGELGKYSIIGSDCYLVANVGRYTNILSDVSRYLESPIDGSLSNSPYIELVSMDQKNKKENKPSSAKIIIGDDVWIGEGVRIKDGVHIGDGAIVESNSVVLEDVEPYTIVGGVPATLVKQRFSTIKRNRIIKSQWTKHDLADVVDIDIFVKRAKKK